MRIYLTPKCYHFILGMLLLFFMQHTAHAQIQSPQKNKLNSVSPANVSARTNAGTASCPLNIDFELGNFTNWETNTGEINTPLTINVPERKEGGSYNFITQDRASWLQNTGLPSRHQLIDRTTSPPNDFYGGFPVNPPFGGGRYALKLGNDEPELDAYTDIPLPMSKTESARYRITVPPAPASENFSIVFAYAVVFEDPKNEEHAFFDRPSFRAYLYNPITRDTIDCLNYTFVATPDLPGFKTSTVKNQYSTDPDYSDVKYKEWTPVFVNLSKYPGQTLYVEFTTTDCTILGHFGYAYVDVIECNYQIKATGSCNANTTSLEGPDGPFVSYEWRSGDNSIIYGTGKNLVLNQALPNNSKVNVIVTPYNGYGCRDTLSALVQSGNAPSVSLGPDILNCGPRNIQIGVDPVSGLTYQWSPAAGLSSTNQSRVTANPSATTNYTLTVIDPATGCRATDNLLVTVAPPISITVNSGSVCPGRSIILNAGGGADTYSWSPATGLSSVSGSSVTATPSSTTNYTVTGINSSNGCRATAQATVTVQGAITISGRGVNPTNCVSGTGSIIISGLTPGNLYSVTYQKDAVAQSPLNLTANSLGEVTMSNLGNGVYQNITLIANGCSSNEIGPFTITSTAPDKPVLSSQLLNFCAGDVTGNINFTTNGGATVSWTNSNPSIGIGAAGNGNITSFTVENNTASPQSADIKVRAVLNGCRSEEETLRIIVNPRLVMTVNSPSTCTGQSVQLTATGASTYSWSPATGLSATNTATVTASPSVTTTYTVTGINSATGCRATAQSTVTINPLPQGNITINGNNQYICDGSFVLLTATGGNTYQWYLNNLPIPGATSSSLQATRAGTYSLELISAENCRSFASARPTFQLIGRTRPDFTPPFGCAGNLVSFTNLSPQANYNFSWELGDGSTSTQFNPTHIYTQNGVYNVKLKMRSTLCNGLIDSITKQVIIEANKSGIRYPTVNTLENTNTNLSARSLGSGYLWQPPVGLNSTTIRNPVFNYNKETEYLIRLTTGGGCVIYDTVLVRVAASADVFVPEIFSPNNDGQNDFLEVFAFGAKKIHFWVFNRWGQLMFETTDPAQRWDGKFQGKPQPLENYVWIVEIETASGQKIRKRGQTILIR